MTKRILILLIITLNFTCLAYTIEDVENWKKKTPIFSMKEHNYSKDINEYFDLYKLKFEDTKHYYGYFKSNGYDIAVHAFLPEKEKIKGTVFIMHGYLVHTGYLAKVTEFLLENGYMVIEYDMPGHGLSSGEKAGIDNFKVYSDVLNDFIIRYKDRLYTDYYIIGHSTGCSAIIDYSNRYDDIFKKRILLAPLIRSSMWHLSKFGCTTVGIFLKRVPRVFRNSSSNSEYLEFQKNIDPIKIKKLPLSWTRALYRWNKEIDNMEFKDREFVIVQGKKDGVVDWEYNMKFLEDKYKEIKFYYFDDAKHDLLNEKKDIQKEVFNIILDELNEDKK